MEDDVRRVIMYNTLVGILAPTMCFMYILPQGKNEPSLLLLVPKLAGMRKKRDTDIAGHNTW